MSAHPLMRSRKICRCILNIPRRAPKILLNVRYFCNNRINDAEADLITSVEEAERFMKDCFIAVGVPVDNAEITATNLVTADYRGHYSHGMNRLEMYIRDIQMKICDPVAKLSIENQTVATVFVDGNNGLGAVIGKNCMEMAIEKARNAGIGMVVVKRSNHYGIAGIYSLQAIKKGMIGISVTNTSPLMVPTRAKKQFLGTNPIAVGAPALNNDSFVLDMATTAVALGKIELAKRKNQPIPKGWALDKKGLPETNASKAADTLMLMPLGGAEENSGYKGYGLGMFAEVLTGILGGSAYGHRIRTWLKTDREANLGQCFVAINPKAFAPGYEERMSDLMDSIRQTPSVDPTKPVLVHGDPERIHMDKVDREGGFRYVKNQHMTNEALAKEFKIKPMVSRRT